MKRPDFLLLLAAEESPWFTVIGILLIGGIFLSLSFMYGRRSKKRNTERRLHNNGIGRASRMSTAQEIDLHPEEPDIDALCSQEAVKRLMDEEQLRTLTAYAKGAGTGELAKSLGMTPEETTVYMNEIFARLEINNRAELLVKLQSLANK